MDLQITSELKEGILVVIARGSIAFDEALRLLKQVFDTAKEKGIASQKNSSRTFGSTVSQTLG